MRLFAVLLLAPIFLACSSSASNVKANDQRVSPTASACPLGDAIRVDFALTEVDNDRKITARLCAVISVRLNDSQGIQSSDDAILAILPLPLPAPPKGGAYAWFQAKRTGLAELSSAPRSSNGPAWTVSVTVVS